MKILWKYRQKCATKNNINKSSLKRDRLIMTSNTIKTTCKDKNRLKPKQNFFYKTSKSNRKDFNNCKSGEKNIYSRTTSKPLKSGTGPGGIECINKMPFKITSSSKGPVNSTKEPRRWKIKFSTEKTSRNSSTFASYTLNSKATNTEQRMIRNIKSNSKRKQFKKE